MFNVVKRNFGLSLAVLICLTGVTFLANSAFAQRDTEAANAEATLQPEARAVVTRLSALHELPDGAWKMHGGDLAHGERCPTVGKMVNATGGWK